METVSDATIAQYERLIFKHAQRVVGVVEMDFEDVVQTYRIKVWQALVSFDPARTRIIDLCGGATACRCARCRYVFMCLKNMEKDLLKKKRHGDLFIEDVAPEVSLYDSSRLQARDKFEDRYLSATPDEVFGRVEDELPLIPSTLTGPERQILVLLYDGYSQADIRRELQLERSAMDRAVRSIRLKFGDWKPASEGPALALVA